MKRLAIVGLGLMGGSLGLAARRCRLVERVSGYARRAETREKALSMGAVDACEDSPGAAVRDADLVVLCVPVLAMPELARAFRKDLKTGAVVTDVGSTKASLSASIDALLEDTGARFVGSHPIAGSDRMGIDAARADLYSGATVVVTGSEPNGGKQEDAGNKKPEWDDAVSQVVTLWRELGSHVVRMGANQHDRVVARTSHLPHLVAAMLVRAVQREECSNVLSLCGSGYRDTSRIAGGSEEIWHDIVKTNTAHLSAELDVFLDEVRDVKRLIETGDFDGLRLLLADARIKRERIPGAGDRPRKGKAEDPCER